MNLSQLKEQVRNILRERSVKSIQKEYSSVVDDIQKHLELYKKYKGTPEEKKHIGHLKTLGEKKKKLSAELDKAVAGLYKNAELKVDEAITNPKKSNPNDLATTVIGWYDFATDYIDDGGQRRTAIKKNDDVVKWFDSHPLDVKQKAFKVMLSKQPSIKSKIERIFGSSLKESVNEATSFNKNVSDIKSAFKEYKKGDKLKIKLPNGKKFDVVFDMYSRTKGVALGKFKNDDGEYNIKPFNLDTIVESVNENKFNAYISSNDGKTFTIYNSNKDKVKNVSKEELEKLMRVGNNYSSNMNWNGFMGKFDKTTNLGKNWKYWKGNLINVVIPSIGENKAVNEATEPQIISQLKDIVKNKQYKMIKDPKTGKSLRVDMQTANAVLQIYNGLSNVNKENMVKMGLPKMIDVSFKIINKYK